MSNKLNKIDYSGDNQAHNGKNEYPIVFRGEGLRELDDIAEMYGISRGEAVIKALKLLKITKTQGSGKITFKEDNQEFSIDSNKL